MIAYFSNSNTIPGNTPYNIIVNIDENTLPEKKHRPFMKKYNTYFFFVQLICPNN